MATDEMPDDTSEDELPVRRKKAPPQEIEGEGLIERAERLSGKRWDDPTGNAMDIIFGALGREMGLHRHRPEDDFATGMLLRNPPKDNSALAAMLAMGFSPDEIHAIVNGKKR